MPQYEFFCNACQKAFSKILTITEHEQENTEHEQEKIACPHCGSKNIEQRWSAFSAVTSKKSA